VGLRWGQADHAGVGHVRHLDRYGRADTHPPSGEPPGILWQGVSNLGHLGQAVVAFEETVVLSAPGPGNVLDDPATAWMGLAPAPFLGGEASHSAYHQVISDPREKTGRRTSTTGSSWAMSCWLQAM
jgi:hypothetical protein